MNSNLKWKVAFILGVILLCVYGLIGLPAFPKSWAGVKKNFSERIKLGLDLQGGTHLILQVKVDEAVSLANDQTRDRLAQLLRDRNIPFESITKIDNTHFLVSKLGPGQTSAFRDLVRDNYSTEWDFAAATGEGENYTMTLRPSVEASIKSETLRQTVETIRRRVDQLGLVEPTVAEHGRGEFEILVQLPGESDPARVKEVIRAGGQLELKLVRGGPYGSEVEALQAHNGVLPPNSELMRGKPDGRTQPGQPAEVWWLLDRSPAVTGRDLRSAGSRPASSGVPGKYDVTFNISAQAAPRFESFTEQNIGKQMAIVLDRLVVTAPEIRGRISDEGMIEGNFTQESAKDLALVLRAGALPASVVYLEERTIGPSLGADSIRHGFWASVASLIGVMIFMLYYYRKAGLNANLALVLNLVILLACLAYFGAVLTLPGIAGVILTIGMGVDSNVLILERIREELRAGKANASAVDAGFDRAFLTIIDTHVTTVVSAVFLFMFGTGPVQGFAVTLVIGLISNLFTAVYVSRTIFGWYLAKQSRGAELSI